MPTPACGNQLPFPCCKQQHASHPWDRIGQYPTAGTTFLQDFFSWVSLTATLSENVRMVFAFLDNCRTQPTVFVTYSHPQFCRADVSYVSSSNYGCKCPDSIHILIPFAPLAFLLLRTILFISVTYFSSSFEALITPLIGSERSMRKEHKPMEYISCSWWSTAIRHRGSAP